MACERYREALTDFAAGGLLPAELEAHLETCAACREELAVSRRALETVDADLGQLAAVEPSRDLAARIRLAAAELAAAEEVANAWHPAFALRALAVGVLVAVLAFVLFRGRAPSPASVATVSPRPPQTEAMPRSSPPASEAPAASRSTVSARPMEGVRRLAPPARPALPPEPEVLVPPGQLEALQRLASLVNREHVASPSLAAVQQGSPELAEPRPIDLGAIDIKPLEIVPSDAAEEAGT